MEISLISISSLIKSKGLLLSSLFSSVFFNIWGISVSEFGSKLFLLVSLLISEYEFYSQRDMIISSFT